MPRKIVICLDGTGNQVGARNPTNVVKLFEMLAAGDPARQLLYYDPGVGTMSAATARGPLGRGLSRTSGLAFGTGLRANLVEAYTYLMQHWQPEDSVYVFGFSRGAYTARALVGMLNKPGLMRPGSENLVPYAVARYAFNQNIDQSMEAVARFSHAFCRITENEPLWNRVKLNNRQQVSRYALPIAYLGLWDTVKAAGILRLGNLHWPYTHQLPNAARIRHAVSLDEKRRPYREFLVTPRPEPVRNTLEEVWFAGVHSDVGGTFDHREHAPLLSTITLKWITDGVCGTAAGVEGLDFRPGAYAEATALNEDFASAPVHDNGPLWILVGRRSRAVPDDAVFHASVGLRHEQDPTYRPDLPAPDAPGRWADPDWVKPACD
ncbi:DUF2235 domain-containing protein [Streptomyces hokutonensis]|uniref:DUF2235 domain-containing protein n=1 Tax=Streptomyces hokutonensis TaxID=1306990 RepID=UPI000378C031|nr:DUF2235 domain-containing protein [Streptomyces hokutonensis]